METHSQRRKGGMRREGSEDEENRLDGWRDGWKGGRERGRKEEREKGRKEEKNRVIFY